MLGSQSFRRELYRRRGVAYALWVKARAGFVSVFVVLLCPGCATVHQSDLDAWVNVPVVALDTHSFFVTLPMVKTITDTGVEIRVYSNKVGISTCGGGAFKTTSSAIGGTMSYANFAAFQNCSSRLAGCDGVFYIRDGRVIEAKPVGRCYTNETMRPERGYERFMNK